MKNTLKAENKFKGLFARKIDEHDPDTDYAILYVEDGELVTRIDADVYPVDSNLGARYEHPEGIKLTLADVKKLGITIE